MKDLYNAVARIFKSADDVADFAVVPTKDGTDNSLDMIDSKLIEVSERIQKLIEAENIASLDRVKNLATATAQMQAATSKILASAAAAEQEAKDAKEAANIALEEAKKSRAAHFQRMSGIVTVIAEGVQGIVIAPATARFKKLAGHQTVRA